MAKNQYQVGDYVNYEGDPSLIIAANLNVVDGRTEYTIWNFKLTTAIHCNETYLTPIKVLDFFRMQKVQDYVDQNSYCWILCDDDESKDDEDDEHYIGIHNVSDSIGFLCTPYFTCAYDKETESFDPCEANDADTCIKYAHEYQQYIRGVYQSDPDFDLEFKTFEQNQLLTNFLIGELGTGLN